MKFSYFAILCIFAAAFAAISVRAEECCESNGDCYAEGCFLECEEELDGFRIECDCKMPGCGIAVIVVVVVVGVGLCAALIGGLVAFFVFGRKKGILSRIKDRLF
ncbi:hypothetical protein QOT17_000228 [Balamuthia mandrillaris]